MKTLLTWSQTTKRGKLVKFEVLGRKDKLTGTGDAIIPFQAGQRDPTENDTKKNSHKHL